MCIFKLVFFPYFWCHRLELSKIGLFYYIQIYCSCSTHYTHFFFRNKLTKVTVTGNFGNNQHRCVLHRVMHTQQLGDMFQNIITILCILAHYSMLALV